jgi:hypothetical protein
MRFSYTVAATKRQHGGREMTNKPRKRRLSAKQKTSTLFHFWHNLQDIKGEAEQLKDGELVLLIGMMELLVEERIALLGGGRSAMLVSADTAHPH